MTCPYGCNDDACNGQDCRTAITVGGFPFTFEGSAQTFQNTYIYQDESIYSMCRLGGAAPGQDVVFRVPLTEGQVLTVDGGFDVGNIGDTQIMVRESCDPTLTGIGASGIDSVLRFEAPADSDHFVFVDRNLVSPGRIIATFDVE